MNGINSEILTFDPSGTSETGWFRFRNIDNWEIGTIDGENAVEHAEKLNILVKKVNPLYLSWETSQFLKVKYANADLLELIYLNGIIPYICKINNITPANMYKVYNLETARIIASDKITGLAIKQVQGERGRPKNIWYFHGKQLTAHQRDAIAVFYVVWTKFLKRPWPWNKTN